MTRLAKRLLLKMLLQHEGALSVELGSERHGGSEALKDMGSPLFYVQPKTASLCPDKVKIHGIPVQSLSSIPSILRSFIVR